MKTLWGLKKPIAFLLLAVFRVFFYTGCTTGNATPSSTTLKLKKRNNYSSEDYFRGIIFQKGPVADLIPESLEANLIKSYTNTNPKGDQNIVKLESKIIEKIKQSQPSFLDNFREVMQSGNQILIKDKISETQDLILLSVAENSGIKVTDPKMARIQLNDFVVQNQNDLKALESEFMSKNITREQYNSEVEKIISKDKTGILSSFNNVRKKNKYCDDQELDMCLALAIAIVLLYAGYIAVVLAAAVETAGVIHFSVYLWKVVDFWKGDAGVGSGQGLRYDQYINSIANNLKIEA